ncbi:MAG TPA: hypothetical protein VNX27_01625 [Chthoniobacterales bacterium]|jgi:hypothetical protein|nr:hypothetical protein [Chthoniobacterales bacterium]
MLRTLVIAPVFVLFCAAAPPESTDAVSFTGGDGTSIGQAIVVHAPSEASGVDAEKNYIAKHFGPPISSKVDIYPDPKRGLFDIWRFTTADGKTHVVYFDINSYVGH